MTAPTDKALSYVPQIIETWTELGKANANKVHCAIKLGELLHGAKEALGKKGDWMEFRAQHFHEISQRTANVYMYLAEHYKALLDDPGNSQRAANILADKELTIRGALKALAWERKTSEERTEILAARKKAADEREQARIEKAEEAERLKGQSASDPAAILEDLEPADVLDNIKDQDKREQLLIRQFRDLTPPRLVYVLEEAWEDEDRNRLQFLNKAITQRLAEPPIVKRRKLPGDQPAAQPTA